MEKRLLWIKRVCRISLGLVWFYEGLVPKILFVEALPQQTALVLRSGLYYPTPEATLLMLGFAQAVAGVVMIVGWAERSVVALATGALFVLMALVAFNKPEMLFDPFGALVKDLCLIACAVAVWLLAPVLKSETA